MKLILVLSLAVVASAAPQYQSIFQDYHEEVGIPAAARLKAAEEAVDFDGARIVGGSAARLGQFPFVAGLVVTLLDGRTSVCNAALVSNTRAVTAAQCWRHGNNLSRHLVVVLGSTTLFSGGTRITTSQVEMHPAYNTNNLNNNIAVIRLSHVNFSNTINRIALATGSSTFAGATATAIGYGVTADNAAINTNLFLNHASLQVISNAECQQVYGSGTVTASTMCVSTAGRRGPCDGDHGSPLVAGNQLIGVMSFTSFLGCSLGFPAGYVRVTSFAPWIQARL